MIQLNINDCIQRQGSNRGDNKSSGILQPNTIDSSDAEMNGDTWEQGKEEMKTSIVQRTKDTDEDSLLLWDKLWTFSQSQDFVKVSYNSYLLHM